jgi:hypothetical protein
MNSDVEIWRDGEDASIVPSSMGRRAQVPSEEYYIWSFI